MAEALATVADIVVCSTAQSIAIDAAHRFVALCGAATRSGKPFTVALAGGRTPEALYKLLASPRFRESVDWTMTHLFFGDERCVPVDSPFCNYRMAHEALIGSIEIPAANVHRIAADQPNPEQAASDYQSELARIFGSGQVPAFDLILLGMGSDGHCASLFPGTAALAEKSRLVVRNEPGLEPFVPRVTLTLTVLNNARNVLFLVAGADKAETAVRVLEGPYAPTELPSQSVRPTGGTLTWLMDRAAAHRLAS